MNKEITVQGFTPTLKQKEIIDACLSKNIKYIIGCFGRQAGKSFTAMNLLLKWALEDNNSVSMWVSPVYSQAKKSIHRTYQYNRRDRTYQGNQQERTNHHLYQRVSNLF